MLLAARITLLACAFAALAVQGVHFVHMLQLNSYRTERYKRWCFSDGSDIVRLPRLLPAVLLPLMWLSEAAGLWSGAAVLLLTALLNIPKKAKKKLVVTPRVRRLFATVAVWYALILGLCGGLYGFIGYQRCMGIVAVVSLLPWLWVGLCNVVNTPIERRISQRFTDEAVAILRACPDLQVVGITGSYGKTSTKNFLHALLSARYQTLMTPESYNTPMGVVRTVREQLRPSHEVFLVEMGARQTGDIRELCELARPRYGIIASVGPQHLETFGSVEQVVAGKFELADAIPEDGCLFLNADNDLIREQAARMGDRPARITYGTAEDSDADYRASDIAVGRDGSTFTVTAPDGSSARFTTKLLGAHNIQNLVGCIAVAHTLGIPLAELAYPVRLIKPVQHRLQLLGNGFIDDAYNANPAGFRAALDVLSGFDCTRVLVTPGCVELGEQQESINRELGAYAAARCDVAVLVGKRQAPPLKEGLLSAGFDENRLYVASDLQDALGFVAGIAAPRIVLLENDLPDNY